MDNNFFNNRYRQSFFKKGNSASKKIETEVVDTQLKDLSGYNKDIKEWIKIQINTVNTIILECIINNDYENDALLKKIEEESGLNVEKGDKSEEKESVWKAVSTPIINTIKLELITKKSTVIFALFEEKIHYIVSRYARQLPHHVRNSETDDLKTIAQLEFVETYKAWQPDDKKDIWPLAYTRITGAMKDHIRYITKADPSRIYDWINDAAYIYMANERENNFEKEIETGVQLNKAMECLNAREKNVVLTYTKKDLTFGEIGKQLSISESQVSRIYKGALQKMRAALKDD